MEVRVVEAAVGEVEEVEVEDTTTVMTKVQATEAAGAAWEEGEAEEEAQLSA